MVIPEAKNQPLTIVEFQFQADDRIYRRTVVEMAAVQDVYPERAVQGIIFFGYNNLDPKTVPWTQVVRSFVLPDLLREWERQWPRHPLAAVFKPLLTESEEGFSGMRAGISGPSGRVRWASPAGGLWKRCSSVGWNNGSKTRRKRRLR